MWKDENDNCLTQVISRLKFTRWKVIRGTNTFDVETLNKSKGTRCNCITRLKIWYIKKGNYGTVEKETYNLGSMFDFIHWVADNISTWQKGLVILINSRWHNKTVESKEWKYVFLPRSVCCNVVCQQCIRLPRSSWGWCLRERCRRCWRHLAAWSCNKAKISWHGCESDSSITVCFRGILGNTICSWDMLQKTILLMGLGALTKWSSTFLSRRTGQQLSYPSLWRTL